jgi:5-methyltetrahydrofolate--homocysteine methyltransferase
MTSNIRTRLEHLLSQRILVLDGAMGTMIQRHKLTEQDFRGERFRSHPKDLRGNNDMLVLTRPDIIRSIHEEYLAAGADIIETNSFSGTRIAQADYGLEPFVYELNVEAAKVARQAVDAWTTPARPRFVAGAIGPTNKTLSMSPDVNDPAFRAVSFDEMRDAFLEQVRGLIDGGVDVLLIETIIDTLSAKAALLAAAEADPDGRVPIILSATITDRSGRTLSGQTIDAALHGRALSRGDDLREQLPERRAAERLRGIRSAGP